MRKGKHGKPVRVDARVSLHVCCVSHAVQAAVGGAAVPQVWSQRVQESSSQFGARVVGAAAYHVSQ